MLIVVSPAKSLDFESPLATRKSSEPIFVDRAAELVSIMRERSPSDLASLMSISAELAELNVERFQDWAPDLRAPAVRPAVLAFNGDTYQGLDAAGSFDARDFTRAQKTLRILSGLYGVLRPLDLIAPYRLEMGSRVVNPAGADLYAFWKPTVTAQLRSDIEASPGTPALVNLASQEYFRAVDTDSLGHRVVTPTFLDADADGNHRTVGFFAKRARGAMARWMITERVGTLRDLSGFEETGYRYDPDASTTTRPVFRRPAQETPT